MTRGQLAARTGCHAETVRYYEQIGLLAPPPRSAGGHRVYGERDERRLRFVLRGRELGFGIDELRELLSLVDRRVVTCEEVRRTALVHLEEVRRRIADLRRMERTLAATAARCRGGNVPECPILDVLSGSGPDPGERGAPAAGPRASRGDRAGLAARPGPRRPPADRAARRAGRTGRDS